MSIVLQYQSRTRRILEPRKRPGHQASRVPVWVASSLGKADKFGVARSAILSDAFVPEPSLHVEPPSFVKAYFLPFHDLPHLSLSRLIQTLPLIAAIDILLEIEVVGREAVLNVGLKRSRQTGVDVFGNRYVRDPRLASQVQGFGSTSVLRTAAGEGSGSVANEV